MSIAVSICATDKRGDIDNTTRAYARAIFDVYGCDAITANPYLGRDALAPFLDRADRGTYILCRTSNPGAADIAELDVAGEPLYVRIAERAPRWTTNGNIGLVVGAALPFVAQSLVADILPPPAYIIEAYLEATLTVNDPATYSRPWTSSWTLQWVPGLDPEEYYCDDNNKDGESPAAK